MRQDSCPKLFVYDAKPLAVFTTELCGIYDIYSTA